MKEVIFEVTVDAEGSLYTATGFACPIVIQASSLCELREKVCSKVRTHYQDITQENILIRLHLLHREELTICKSES